MSTLKFSDGMTFDTSGPLRTTRRSDGLYVIGNGWLIPVKDDEEAEKIIDSFSKPKNESNKNQIKRSSLK